MKSDKICIGLILKPQGVVGEIKLKDLSAGFNTVKGVKSAFIDGKEYTVLQIRSFGGALFLTFKGVTDRDQAELLRNKEVFCFRSEIVIPEGEYFIVDVIGCDLCLSSGKNLGKIIDIADGKVDLYTIETSEGKAVFPMLKDLSPIFDIENNRVTVDAKRFTEVVLYED